jgi:hypothetical protein
MRFSRLDKIGTSNVAHRVAAMRRIGIFDAAGPNMADFLFGRALDASLMT